MGQLGKAQLQSYLQALQSGELAFDTGDLDDDSYVSRVGDTEYQVQLRAAFELFQGGTWDKVTYDEVGQLLKTEFCLDFVSEDAKPVQKKVFNPFAQAKKGGKLPKNWYWDVDGVARKDPNAPEDPEAPKMTGTVPAAEGNKSTTKRKGRKAKATDPCRNKTGRFLEGVAELWYYSPETGMLCREAFTEGHNAIAQAYRRGNDIQSHWDRMGVTDPCAWVKSRTGDMKGNRHVHVVAVRGMWQNPQVTVQLQKQAYGAKLTHKVGEFKCQTKVSDITLMLAQNRKIGLLDRDITCVDIPCVEADDSREIVYAIRMFSGDTREIKATPCTDVKDDDGNITLEGHKRRAYKLLLESPTAKADSPKHIKYVVYGKGEELPKSYVIGRDEAIQWDQGHGDDEIFMLDATLREAAKAYRLGEITAQDWKCARQEHAIAKSKRMNKLDPAPPIRGKQVTSSGRTNVNYNSDGTVNWQKASNSGGPGTSWKSREAADLHSYSIVG